MASDEETLRDVYQEMEDLGLKKNRSKRRLRVKEKPEREGGRFWQIDVLKVIAMLLVIMDHSTTHGQLFTIGSPFWERIAIPIFMIVLGFNWAKSLQKNKHLSYRKMFNWNNYWKNKIVHFIVPYGILYIASFIMSFFIQTTQDLGVYGHPKMRYLLFPWVYGPGSWFIMALFLTILVFPLVFMIFDKIPIVGLLLAFGVEIGWQFLMSYTYDWFDVNRTYERYILFFSTLCTPFILMSAIGMGVWLSQNHKIFHWRNIIIWVLGLLSIFMIYIYTFTPASWLLSMDWSLYVVNIANRLHGWARTDYNFLFFPYSALIVMVFLNILPRNPKGGFARFITLLSKSTFHILMVQIFYFSILYNRFLPMFGSPMIWTSVLPGIEWVDLIFYPMNVVITFSLGTSWYWLENKFIWSRLKRRSSSPTKVI